MEATFGKKLTAAPRGVALILVMLAILVLSVLAASIVFSARSETFASYNYRISTQADYVAKAGLQKALNFFNSDQYRAVDPTSPSASYQVSQYATTPVTLYNATTRAVKCITTSSPCATNSGLVTLAVNSSGAFNGNYPTNFTNASGNTIPTAFASNFYNVALNPLGSATNSGQFTVTATLEEYYTVNDAFYPTINRKPYEVWFVSSRGTWNSNVGAGIAKPTSVQEATLAPVYLPYFANALYGMCNILMNGNVCTDSYRSTNGAYNGSNPSNCVTSTGVNSNGLASGAGIGSGGGVTLNGGSYTVNGDVSYGAAPPTYSSLWTCSASSSGVTGSVSGVTGTVQPVPAIPEPPMPTFPNCTQYGGAAACPGIPPNVPNPGLGNNEYVWTHTVSGTWYYTLRAKVGASLVDTNYLLTGSGTSTDPYRLPVVQVGNGGALCLAGGTDSSSAIYYAVTRIDEGNGFIYTTRGSSSGCPPAAAEQGGYAVLDIYQTLSIGAQGITSGGAPPSALAINVYNSGNNSGTSVTINGQGNVSAVITALGGATLGGGGTGGAFYGSILAGSITDGGSYAVHYDQSLQVLSGKLTPMAIRNYNRPKH
jgi:Tfp pilus assembly protein PilX